MMSRFYLILANFALKGLFNYIDSDNDGKISTKELQDLSENLKKLHKTLKKFKEKLKAHN